MTAGESEKCVRVYMHTHWDPPSLYQQEVVRYLHVTGYKDDTWHEIDLFIIHKCSALHIFIVVAQSLL